MKRALARGDAAAARDRGLAETCPQYLFLSIADYDRPGVEGAKYVMSPPLREAADQTEGRDLRGEPCARCSPSPFCSSP